MAEQSAMTYIRHTLIVHVYRALLNAGVKMYCIRIFLAQNRVEVTVSDHWLVTGFSDKRSQVI